MPGRGEKLAQDLGTRVKKLRERLRLSQAELARAAGVTSSYMSLVEGGHRLPRQPHLEAIALALKATSDYLLTGNAGCDRLQSEVDFAEIALRNGDRDTALKGFQSVVGDSAANLCTEVLRQAQWGLARTNEQLGDYDAALAVLDDLRAATDLPASMDATAVVTETCYVLLKKGEFSQAIKVGQAELDRLRAMDAGLKAVRTKGFTELASTLVGCYRELGQLAEAQDLAQEAIGVAEKRGTLRERGAAYWQAATAAKAAGNLSLARALNDRAKALASEDANDRAVASLKVNGASFALADKDPDLPGIISDLKEALEVFKTDGSSVEMAETLRVLASAHLLAKDLTAAWDAITEAAAYVPANAVVERAYILKVEGEIRQKRGDRKEDIVSAYTGAAKALAEATVKHESRLLLRDVATGLMEAGASEQAADLLLRLVG
ncbi:MAG: helix-turn-helix domain-containing protein [Frankiaceae bacterium]